MQSKLSNLIEFVKDFTPKTLRRVLHANPGAKIEVGVKRLIKGNAQEHCVAYDQMANRNKSMS